MGHAVELDEIKPRPHTQEHAQEHARAQDNSVGTAGHVHNIHSLVRKERRWFGRVGSGSGGRRGSNSSGGSGIFLLG